MKLLIEKIPDMQALYLRELRLLLSAEELIAFKTPFLRDTTTDSELNQAFQLYIQESEARAAQLREILKQIEHEPAAHPLKCKVIYALFDEAEELIEASAHYSVRNAAIISAALRIKHYQIAAYGVIRQFAHALGCHQDVQLLDQILREEGQASRHLSGIAERVNSGAKKAA